MTQKQSVVKGLSLALFKFTHKIINYKQSTQRKAFDRRTTGIAVKDSQQLNVHKIQVLTRKYRAHIALLKFSERLILKL